MTRLRSRYSRLPSRPTGKGLVAAVFAASLFLIGTNTGSAWLYLLSSGCVATLALSIAMAHLALRNIGNGRRSLLRCSAGETVEYALELECKGRARGVVLSDPAPNSAPMVIEDVPATRRLRGGKPARLIGTVRARPLRRGLYLDPALVAACEAPFGLWRAIRQVQCEGTVEIAPLLADVGFPKELARHSLQGDGKLEPPKRGRGYDFFALREYQPGDPVRNIYWPATAKSEEVIVREFEEEGVSPLAVVADLRWVHGGEVVYDRVLQVAGCLAKAAVKMHVPVRLALPSGDPSGPAVLDSPSASTLRSVLAAAPAPVAAEAVAEAVAAALRFPRASLVIVKPMSASLQPYVREGTVRFVFEVEDLPRSESERRAPEGATAARAWQGLRAGSSGTLVQERVPEEGFSRPHLGASTWIVPLEGEPCFVRSSTGFAA